jgi:hypothetical protein
MVVRRTERVRTMRYVDRSAAEHWATTRLAYLDNLKVVLIAAIIAMHGILGYAGFVEAWTYSGMREVTLSPVVEIVLFVLVSPFGLFLMALLFLVAGLLTPGSYERKGSRRFVGDRLLRLGVPFAVYVFVVQPTIVYAVEHPFGDASGSYWDEYLGAESQIDTGPLWFVGVLLIFSLGYAALLHWRRPRSGGAAAETGPSGGIGLRRLLVLSAVVAPTSFAVRLVWPYGSEAGFSDLNFWQWPSCLAVFGLGIVASRQGWVEAIPGELAHRCRTFTLPALVAMAAVLFIAGANDALDDALGGWHVLAAAFAVVEAILTVLGSVWLLSVAQRRLARRHRWGPVLGRSAYAAFMLQTPFLLGLAAALRPVPVPAEVKAVIVAGLGVVASFAAAWFLIKKVPGVSRVL